MTGFEGPLARARAWSRARARRRAHYARARLL